MKKLIVSICLITASTSFASADRTILVCPAQLLDETNEIHDQSLYNGMPELVEEMTLNDAVIILSHLAHSVTTLATQPQTAARIGVELATLIASLMEVNTRRPRPKPTQDPDIEPEQRNNRIRDVILATCINILSNVAVITAHPHDHKMVASQATLMATNILNAVKETVRSSSNIKDAP